MSGVSFGGLATGLPADLVDQLMASERAPIDRFRQRIGRLETADTAWSGIVTKLSGLRTATEKLLSTSAWGDLWNVTSSDESSVGVSMGGVTTGGGIGAPASLSFTVVQLARTHSVTSGDRFTGPGDSIGARTLSIGGTEVTSSDGTLGGLVTAINADTSLGVSARAVQVEPGAYQLQLTARSSGAAAAFAVASTGWGGGDTWTVTQSGRDAIVSVDGLEIRRAGNAIDDLVEGVVVELRKAGPDEVTVGVSRDVDQTVERVQSFVTALNGVLGDIRTKSRYNTAAGTSAPLTGDATARRLATALTDAVLRSGSTGAAPASFGLTITRDGNFTLDTAKLRTALSEDYAAVSAAFARVTNSSSSADVRISGVAARTVNGSYQVDVLTPATAASVTGSGGAPVVDETLEFTADGRSATVTIAAGTVLDDAVDEINTALRSAGLDSLAASGDGGVLRIADSRLGSSSFSVSSATDQYGVAGTHRGTDVVVAVDGQQHTGTGRAVTIGSGPGAGLSLVVGAGAPTTAMVTVREGLAGLMERTLTETEGTDGSIARARAFLDGRIDDVRDRIDVFERRLEGRRLALQRQFAALESIIGQLKNTSSWMSQQLAALPKS